MTRRTARFVCCATSRATTRTFSRSTPPRRSASVASRPARPTPPTTSIAHHVEIADPATLAGGNLYGSQLLHVPGGDRVVDGGAAAGSDRHAAAGRDLLRAQISVVSWTYAIKLAAERTRPNGDPRSFPSGHASTSFATATVLAAALRLEGRRAGLRGRRLYRRCRGSPTTSTGRATWCSARPSAWRQGGRSRFISRTRVSLAPLAVPGGGGVLVAAVR